MHYLKKAPGKKPVKLASKPKRACVKNENAVSQAPLAIV